MPQSHDGFSPLCLPANIEEGRQLACRAPPDTSGGALLHIAMLIVPIEKGRFRIEPDCRTQRGVLELRKIVARLAAMAFAQLPRDANAPLAIYRDKPAIKCAIERR